MFKKPPKRIFSLVLILIGLFTGTASAQSILIFSTSHNNTGTSNIEESEGVMKLMISTFSPITEVRINNEVRPVQGTTVRFDVPYSLKEGENQFRIQVVTDKAETQKTFILNYIKSEAAETPGRSPFQLIALAGLTHTDNATAVKEDKTAGTKLSLTVIPQYWIAMDRSSDLVFEGIVMREKYSDSDLKDYETVFNQLNGKYINRAEFGDWQLTAGWNDIGGKTDGLSSDTKVETNLFIGGALQLKALDDKNVNLGLMYTTKDAEEPVFEDYDRDGTLLNLYAEWKRKISGIDGKLTGDYDFNDAKGLYNDYTALGVGVGAKYPLNKQLSLSGSLDMKTTSYKESDPIKGDKESSTLNTLSVGGAYKIPKLSGFIAIGDLTMKRQSSNITTREYNENLVSVSLVYIY